MPLVHYLEFILLKYFILDGGMNKLLHHVVFYGISLLIEVLTTTVV